MAEQGLAYARALAGSAATYTAGTRERVQAMWAVYRPTSLLGWTVSCLGRPAAAGQQAALSSPVLR